MANKIALQGFSGFQLFPVIQNDSSGYEVGTSFHVPWVQSMTRETDASEQKIYADDTIYLNMKSWNGITATITVAEMTLEMLSKLGFGAYDSVDEILKWNPQGSNKEFAVSFKMLRADGNYRMQQLFSFTVNEVRESNVQTKGEGNEVNAYQIIGTFAARVKDGRPGFMKDSTNPSELSWLDTIVTD